MGDDFVKRLREKEQSQLLLVKAVEELEKEPQRRRRAILRYAVVVAVVLGGAYALIDTMLPAVGTAFENGMMQLVVLLEPKAPRVEESKAMTKLTEALNGAPAAVKPPAPALAPPPAASSGGSALPDAPLKPVIASPVSPAGPGTSAATQKPLPVTVQPLAVTPLPVTVQTPVAPPKPEDYSPAAPFQQAMATTADLWVTMAPNPISAADYNSLAQAPASLHGLEEEPAKPSP